VKLAGIENVSRSPVDGSTKGFLGIAISVTPVKVFPLQRDQFHGFLLPAKTPYLRASSRALKGRCSIELSYGRKNNGQGRKFRTPDTRLLSIGCENWST
jgi:hypothetical protein